MNNNELFEKCTECLKKELPVLRKMAGLTQKDLGEILGVSRQTITNIENGTGKFIMVQLSRQKSEIFIMNWYGG